MGRTNRRCVYNKIQETMTVKELKEALANVPDDAEVCIDDGYSITLIYADNAEHDEYNNIFTIA